MSGVFARSVEPVLGAALAKSMRNGRGGDELRGVTGVLELCLIGSTRVGESCGSWRQQR